ncbi:MAG: UDP-N-acetylmuramate dehydrogenase [Saprospiraceae bacterium]|nr:UDP-N-acetylmuramate dehydrogenase [Saprospiraceae bacterium]MCB9319531.1 UDP-N-acetylmuramate dehydrogenase [Lewinellaceae bacterium]
MIWETDKSLRELNTFGVQAKSAFFAQITDLATLESAVREQPAPFFILGGGSNILFTDDLPAAVLSNQIQGIDILQENDDEARLAVGAGMRWHDLVMWSVERGYGGLENLALIPGQVGAAPIQNIGAYGVEVGSVIEAVDAYDLEKGEVLRFPASVCEFGYRTSIFKTTYRNKLFILRVYFRLLRHPVLHLDYGAIRDELKAMDVKVPDVREVSNAIIRIRQSKLPDPAKIGNAGSFFKNPTVSLDAYEAFLNRHPDIPGYPAETDRIKIPAAWFIDHLGWKGYRMGDAGVHEKHALVLVNYGDASGQDIVQLAIAIQRSVEEAFGISLEPEVNIVG